MMDLISQTVTLTIYNTRVMTAAVVATGVATAMIRTR